MITKKRLEEVLSYDPRTGVFINITNRGKTKKGSIAGTKHHKGYIIIAIDGKTHRAHRLAWLYVYGKFPEKYLDHINEVKDDNRIVNLRLATNQENQHNISNPRVSNTSGYVGVSWHKRYDKWIARIKINGKKKHLGYFDTAEQASKAYLEAKRKLHPFWVEEKVA